MMIIFSGNYYEMKACKALPCGTIDQGGRPAARGPIAARIAFECGIMTLINLGPKAAISKS